MNTTQNTESIPERPAMRTAFTHRLNCQCDACDNAHLTLSEPTA